MRTVDGLIGRGQGEYYAQANGAFLATGSNAAQQGSVLDGFRAGQQAVDR